MKREARRKQPLDFSQPVIIDEEEYNFTRTILCDNKVSILLPEEFADMPLEIAKQKYPMEQRPQIIKTNTDQSVNFAFNLFPEPFTGEQAGEAVKSFKTLIKRMHPGNRFFTEKVEQPGKMTIDEIIALFERKTQSKGEISALDVVKPISQVVVAARAFAANYAVLVNGGVW